MSARSAGRPMPGEPAARRLRAAALVAAGFLAVLLTVGSAAAQTLTPSEVERRVKALSHELRCLVCQNQTLADSRADLAGDLMAQVTEQVAAGKTDDEVKAYLVARYGDFVLYRPPLKASTAPLWIGPFALLLVGAGVFVVVQRRHRTRGPSPAADQAPDAPTAAPEADADQERAKRLLS